MDSKLELIPRLDPALAPYLRRVLSRFEGVEILGDKYAKQTFVLSLPCAGSHVKCLFDLQDIKMLDIGYILNWIAPLETVVSIPN